MDNTSSRFYFLSSFILGINLLLVNYVFPFWKITEPLSWLDLAFLLIPLIGIISINLALIVNLIKRIKKLGKGETIAIFPYGINLFTFIILIVGITHTSYQLNPINNFNSYVRQREKIVLMIQSGQLAGKKNWGSEEGNSREIIQLPPKYKGLSRKGEIRVDREPGKVEIVFTHSTIGFGDGSRDFIYYKSDKDKSSVPYSGIKKLKEHWFYSD
ncbi:hypothetical protein [Allocoleopsis sp.]|uniref:hypothetical protein n=1 Tax=Allocoleopsis sp. TaxID=3088169 RepID=UPI002FD5B2CE